MWYLWERSARNPLEALQGVFFLFLSPIFPSSNSNYLPKFSFQAHASLSTLIINRRLFLLHWFEWRKKASINNLLEKNLSVLNVFLRSVITPSLRTQDADANYSPAVAIDDQTGYASGRKWDRSRSPSHFLSVCLTLFEVSIQWISGLWNVES